MDRFVGAIVAIVTAVLGIALIAVIVGRASQTGQVIKASGSALSEVIGAAVRPAT